MQTRRLRPVIRTQSPCGIARTQDSCPAIQTRPVPHGHRSDLLLLYYRLASCTDHAGFAIETKSYRAGCESQSLAAGGEFAIVSMTTPSLCVGEKSFPVSRDDNEDGGEGAASGE